MAVRLSRFRFTDSLSGALGTMLLVALAQPACADGTLVNINQQSQQNGGSILYSTDNWNSSGIQYIGTSSGAYTRHSGSSIQQSENVYTNSMAFVPLTMQAEGFTASYTFDIKFTLANLSSMDIGVDKATMTSITLDIFSLTSGNVTHTTDQNITYSYTLTANGSSIANGSQNATLQKASDDNAVAAYTKGSDGTYTSAAMGSTVSGARLSITNLSTSLQAGQEYILSVKIEDNTQGWARLSTSHIYRTGIGQLSVGGNSDAYVWIGDKNNTWSSGAANWNHDSNAEAFVSNNVNNAIFGGKGQQKTVSLGEDITADRVIVQTDGYTWDINGKTLKSSSIEISDGATLTVSGAGSAETGKLSGGSTATVKKTGNNTTKLTVSTDDFSGKLQVDAGVLELKASSGLSILDLILNGGELKANEVGAGGVEISGMLKGGAEGTGASGNITLASGGVLDASDAAGSGGIDLAGNITLNYGAQLSQNDLNIFVPGVLPGETYDLLTVTGDLTLTDSEGKAINAKTLQGGYDAANLFTNLTAGYFDLRYSPSSTGDNVGTFYLYTVVPEPTTGTLSLLALAGLAARRRRK